MKYSLIKTKDTIFGFLLFILAVLIYSNSLFGGFIWDDRAAVVSNDILDIFLYIRFEIWMSTEKRPIKNYSVMTFGVKVLI